MAIIGWSGCFPNASSVDDLWGALVGGRELLTRSTTDELRAAGVSEELLQNESYVRVQGVLSDSELFGFDRQPDGRRRH